MLTNETTGDPEGRRPRVYVTVYVTVIAYTLALVFGLLIGLMRVSGSRIAREVSTFYVEIIRGVPMLVILYYIAFVGAPPVVASINWIGNLLLGTRHPGATGQRRWPRFRCATWTSRRAPSSR